MQIISTFPLEWKALMKNKDNPKYKFKDAPNVKNASNLWIKDLCEEQAPTYGKRNDKIC